VYIEDLGVVRIGTILPALNYASSSPTFRQIDPKDDSGYKEKSLD